MVKPKLSVDQISDGLEIVCIKCERVIKKERYVYFTMITVDEQVNNYCFYCIEPFLVNHSNSK